MVNRILVWDVPTRVFHWSLALSFVGAYLTAESERYRDIHIALGYVMCGLILFRLVWGLVGTRYARFADFLYSPVQLFHYLRSLFGPLPQHTLGHNPAGAMAIFLLLALGLLLGSSGVVLYWELGDEDIFEELHEMSANLMLAVVLIHIVGVLVSSILHRENLVRSMLTGYKYSKDGGVSVYAHVWLGALMALVIAVFLSIYLV